MGRDPAWREFREIEFKRFITSLCSSARRRRFSVWTGGSGDPCSVAVSAGWDDVSLPEDARLGCHFEAFCIRMDPKRGYCYMLAEKGDYRPGKIPLSAYTTPIGRTANEAAESAAALMDRAIDRFGPPTAEPQYTTSRLYRMDDELLSKTMALIIEQTDWDQTPWNER